jgi:hypothetical protein
MKLTDDELNTVLTRLTAARLAVQCASRNSVPQTQHSLLLTSASRCLDDLVPLLTRQRPQAPRARSAALRWSEWPRRLGRSALRMATLPARVIIGAVCARTTHALGRA